MNRHENRILQITARPFPPEIRVAKEGLALLNAGYQSAVMCPPLDSGRQRQVWQGISVFRPLSLTHATSTLDKVIFETLFFSPAWFSAIKEVLTEYRPDVIHVHDIWLGRTVFLAKTHQKLVLDLHENMPAAVVEYLKGYRGLFKWFNGVFKHYNRVLRYERGLLERSDGVFVVVEEALRRILQTYPLLERGKIVNIENLESKEFLNEKTMLGQVIDSDHFSILYIGGFGPHRGIDTLIKAMKHIKAWGLNVRLHLVGARNGDYLKTLRELITDLDVESCVTITGWVPADSVLAYIRQVNVGAVPHHSNPHTDTTIPHKLYQYMIASTPVLVSTSPPLARTVQAARAGLIFKAGDDLACAERIREMFHDPNLLQRCGANGFTYVMQHGHNWEDESAPRLIAAYDQLLDISLD